jgi:predicted aspartyl protease
MIDGHFRGDYEAIKVQYPTYEPDQMLAQLWDQGGYSWIVSPMEA